MSKQKKESPAAATAEPSKQAEAQATQADSTSHTSSIVAASEPSEVLKAALFYHSLGFSVFPILPTSDKLPAVKRLGGIKRKPASVKRIKEWFGTGSTFQIGIMLGAVSGGLVCRDFDRHGSYHAWANAYPNLALTLPTVKTPSKGYHVYFRMRIGAIRDYDGCYTKIGHDGIDGEMRVKDVYVLAPPSRLPNGAYEAMVPFARNIPELDLEHVDLDHDWGSKADETQPLQPTHAITAKTGQPKSVQAINSSATKKGAGSSEHPLPHDVMTAIWRTLPTGYGQRHHKIFDFVRELKAIPRYKTPANIMDLYPILKEWHRLALPTIRTKEIDESWDDFTHSYKNAKYAAGEGQFEEAVELAKTSVDPPEALVYERKERRFLVRLCQQLQINAGNAPFYLGCEKFSQTIGENIVSKATAARWLKGLVECGILELVKEGTRESKQTSEYWYRGTLQ